MKLLLFSDVHCSQTAIDQLLKRSELADVLVGAGDFAVMRKGLAKTMQPFADLDKPLVAVCGNGESDQELADAVNGDHIRVLHATACEIDGVTFFGLGGGIPVTPFGSWSFDLSEEAAAEHLAKSPTPLDVLVVHSPPHGAVDRCSKGNRLGSTAIRDFVIASQPKLVVCGHIHDSAGQWERIGDSVVVNAGPAGLLWDLECNEVVEA